MMMELDIGVLFNGLVLLVVTALIGWIKSISVKSDENRERLIRLEERARKKDEKVDSNGNGYLD